MTKKSGMGLGLFLACSLLGACRTTYNIQGKEAVRALRMLGDGDASAKRDKAVVRAKNAKSEESVWIELRSSDYVRLRRCPEEPKQDIVNREEWGSLEFLSSGLDCVDIQFVQPLGTRGTLFWTGVGLTGGSIGLQLMTGLTSEKNAPPSWVLIPYYGSFRLMKESW